MARERSHLIVAAALALVACDPADDGNGGDGGTGAGGTDGGGAASCEEEERADEFVAGMEKEGANGLVYVTLLDSDPAPPIRADNRWTVEMRDAAGMPVVDAEIDVEPRMPDHGHGTPVVTMVTAGETDGEYVLDPVNLFMQGYWEVNIDVVLSDGGEDAVMFPFCVD